MNPLGQQYRIKLRDHIDRDWSDWLQDSSTLLEPGLSVLTGYVADQAQLQGLLRQFGKLGLEIVTLQQITVTSQEKTS